MTDIRDTRARILASGAQVLGDAVESDDVWTAGLTGRRLGVALRGCAPALLAPLGPGAAQALMGAFLSRLAQRIQDGEPPELRGTLVDLFAPELRDPTINDSATDPTRDGALLSSLVRPTLSRLRQAATGARWGPIGHRRVLSLVIDGAERSRGPVRQEFRIAVLSFPEYGASVTLPLHRAWLLTLLREGIDRFHPAEHLRLSALAPLDRVVRRLLDDVKDTQSPRCERLTLAAVFAVLSDVLPVLRDLEKASVLSAVFDLPLAPRVTLLGAPRDLESWFLNAVLLRAAPTDCFPPTTIISVLSSTRALTFAEKIVLAKLYDLARDDQEYRDRVSSCIDMLSFLGVLSVPAPEGASLGETLARRVSSVADYTALVARRAASALEANIALDAGAVPLRFTFEKPAMEDLERSRPRRGSQHHPVPPR